MFFSVGEPLAQSNGGKNRILLKKGNLRKTKPVPLSPGIAVTLQLKFHLTEPEFIIS